MNEGHYDELEEILVSALKVSSEGKGIDRHGTDPFWINQPILEIQRMQGSSDFPLGQVIKKCIEIKKLTSLDEIEEELLGAIGYLAGAIQFHREKDASNKVNQNQ